MSSKAHLYASSLDGARRADLFESVCPVDSNGRLKGARQHAPDGLEWKELVRKFSKHNGQREVTGQAALTELAIRNALAKAAHQSDHDHDKSHALDMPAAGGGAHARMAWPALVRSEDRSNVLTAIQSLDNSIRNATGSDVDKGSAKIIKAFGLFSVGDCQNALRELDDLPEKQLAIPLAHSEAYDRTLRVLAYAVEGYSHDLLGDSHRAVNAYLNGIKEYSRTRETLPSATTNVDTDPILLGLGEDLIYRAALHTRSQSDFSTTLSLHRSYLRNLQSVWGHTFRPTKAVVMHTSYRSLLHDLGTSKLSKREYHAETARNNRGQEAILRRSTSLPPAGEINKVYLDFLDQVALGWRIGGSSRHGAESVIKICYNALTHTFQSQRLLRHLSRALVAVERWDEVKKALELYYDMWDKARETDADQVAKDVRKFRRKNDLEKKGANKQDVERLLKREEDDQQVKAETDFDDDATFVEFAVYATRVWCRSLKEPEHAKTLMERAKGVIDDTQDAPLKGNARVQSAVHRSLGLVHATMAAVGDEYEQRTTNQATALKYFEDAVSFDPTSSEAHYCLAYQLGELRQVTLAIEHARQAVELDSTSKQAWHLLGLLVASQRDYEQALQVVETALQADSSRINTAAPSTNGAAAADDKQQQQQPEYKKSSVPSFMTFLTGGASPKKDNTKEATNNLYVDGDRLSNRLSSTPTTTTNWDLPKSDWDVLEEELELRKTRNVLIEFLEGAESAVSDQKSLFAFFTNTLSDINASIEQDDKFEAEQAVAANTEMNNVASTMSSSVPIARRKSISRSKSIKGSSSRPGSIRGADDAASQQQQKPKRAFSIRSGKSRRSVAAAATAEDPEKAGMYDGDTVGGGGGQQPDSTPGGGATSHPRARKMLTDLWLMTAASYRRAGRFDDARGAIQEAERLDADDADVWVQFAALNERTGQVDIARRSLIKALEYAPTDVAATVLLSRLYLLEAKHVPVAEGMLETLTRTKAWDVPEAWFELSRCYKASDRPSKEREALVWALQLEETRSVRELGRSVARAL